MKHGSIILNLVTIAGLAGLIILAPDRRDTTFTGKVTWVTDGDTFQVQGHDWPIRVWGIDAPERDTNAGLTAQAFARGLLMGKTVTCTKRAVDKYRRSVAQCKLAEKDFAKLMIEAGHAKEYCRFTKNIYGTCE